MPLRTIFLPVLVVSAVVAIVAWAARSPIVQTPAVPEPLPMEVFDDVVEQIDRHFDARWKAEKLTPAGPADDLPVLRRLSLVLHGTIPSLEEIRAFEADDQPDRLGRWTARMLDDNRFADYFAERLARAFVGTEGGQFIVYRRDRFVDWLSEQLKKNRPYDEIVREIISARGLWTGRPATNFISVAVNDGEVDENKLAGRCVRAFLGQRIDCAQCHDHPFENWKQPQFEGLAAYFGQSQLSLLGIEDKQTKDGKSVEFEVEDRETLEKRIVAPAVPFHPEWLPETGTRREKLAHWITHPDNRRFERAIANRVWGLLFGKPYRDPVDDLPDPAEADDPGLLDLLGADFRRHRCDLRRLIQVIAACKPFRAASTHPCDDPVEFERLKLQWAVFPLTRLRPEQVIGAMLQATSLKTIDQNSHLLVRLIRFFRENDFIKEYGDLGEKDLDEHTGTIPQALLRMNGKLSQETTEPGPLNAAGRISALARSDERRLETCYLVCLSRRPTPVEAEHFLARFRETSDGASEQTVADIFWSLFNSPEFSWNH